jgi:hypothetical protein
MTQQDSPASMGSDTPLSRLTIDEKLLDYLGNLADRIKELTAAISAATKARQAAQRGRGGN